MTTTKALQNVLRTRTGAPNVMWSADERKMVVNTIGAHLRANDKGVADFTAPGWFRFYMDIGQSFLPEERRRRITSAISAPWIEHDLRALLAEPMRHAVSPEIVAQFVASNLGQVIAELEKSHRVVVTGSSAVRPGMVKSKRLALPKVLVVACKPNQAASLAARYGHRLDLRFWYLDKHTAKNTLPQVDHCVGMTGFMDHSLDHLLYSTYKGRYQRVIGSLGGVTGALETILKIG